MSLPKPSRARMDAAIREHVAKTLAEFPPLSSDQLDQLSVLFRGGQATRQPRRQPKPTQIYRHYDKCGCLLYIGISYDAIQRNYAHAGNSWWTKWVDRVQIDEETYADRSAAESAEREFIGAEAPVFNSVHANDQRTSIIRYLIRHERWEHLSVAANVDRAAKVELLRHLDRAGLFESVMYLKEPIGHEVDWNDPVVRRFIVKTETDEKGCWRWQANVTKAGYAMFRHEKTRLAHRAAWLLFRGPIPDGHELRHICGVKDCVNPAHLKPVVEDAPRRTITSMSELCRRNHPGSDPRWGARGDGRRYCRECNRVQASARRSRHTYDS